MAASGARRRLLQLGFLLLACGASACALSEDFPIDIYRITVHGEGAQRVLALVDKYATRARLHCVHNRKRILGTITAMKIPGVDCAHAHGEFVLRAEAYEDPPTHAFIYTFNGRNGPKVSATVERIVAATLAAAKKSSEVDFLERRYCRHPGPPRGIRP